MKTDFQKADLMEVLVGKYGMDLIQHGDYYMGFCPLHDNFQTEAFCVYPNDGPETAQWVCFGGCGKGDVIDFVRAMEGVSFNEALKLASQELNPSNAFLRELEKGKNNDDLDMVVLTTLRQADLIERLGVRASAGILEEVDDLVAAGKFSAADKVLAKWKV